MNALRNTPATTTNANAVPCPAITRSTIPTATVEITIHSASANDMPERLRRIIAAHPTSNPMANGQSVDDTPSTLIPWSWLIRPMITNTRIETKSAKKGTGFTQRT